MTRHTLGDGITYFTYTDSDNNKVDTNGTELELSDVGRDSVLNQL